MPTIRLADTRGPLRRFSSSSSVRGLESLELRAYTDSYYYYARDEEDRRSAPGGAVMRAGWSLWSLVLQNSALRGYPLPQAEVEYV